MVNRVENTGQYIRNVTDAIGFGHALETVSDPFVWKGADAHRPPVKPTPLTERLDDKTVAPVLVLASACLFIASRRLMDRCNVQPTIDIAEALFCFSVDPAYFNIDFNPIKLPLNTPELEASRELRVCVIGIVETEQIQKMSAVPLIEVHPLLAFTRQIVGKSYQEAFDTWLSSAIDRLEDVDPSLPEDVSFADFNTREDYQAYVEACFGSACPFEALNPESVSETGNDRDQIASYLGSLSSRQNDFLRGL